MVKIKRNNAYQNIKNNSRVYDDKFFVFQKNKNKKRNDENTKCLHSEMTYQVKEPNIIS